MIPIGIDLGTTFSAVATIAQSGKPVIVKNSYGDSTTPSVICFPPGKEPIVGREAKESQAFGETYVAAFFKRNMGDNISWEFNGKNYSPVDLSAILLKKIKADAEKQLGQKIEAAVITVPAYFNDYQRNATMKAAEMAGIKVLRLIHEPTAAAIAYGVTRDTSAGSITMVYDLGGGTFDVSLVKSSNSEIKVIASEGDYKLGGKDWDDRIASYLAEQFNNEFGLDIFEDKESTNELMTQCEQIKIALSSLDSKKTVIMYKGECGKYTLTRAQFVELTKDLLNTTNSVIESVFESSGYTWDRINNILLVGGSTKMPMVSEFLEKISGKPPLKGINPDEAVALGAALQAASDLNSMGRLVLETSSSNIFTIPTIKDVMSHSLGNVAKSEDLSKYVNKQIIKKNTPIPCENSEDFLIPVSSRQGDNIMEVYMLQGESESPLDCVILGKYIFHDIAPTQSGKAIVRVHYAYNQNGIVEVRGEQISDDKRTATSLRMTIEPVPEDMSWLSRSPQQMLPTIGLVIAVDVSYSMEGEPLAQAKKAALALLEKLDLNRFHVGVVAFYNSTDVLTELSNDRKTIDRAIRKLSCGPCTSAIPFDTAMRLMKNEKGGKYIVVLTDGEWEYAREAIRQADRIKDEGAEIIAIGFGEANYSFLKAIASCDENALFTDLSKLVDSFIKVGQILSSDNTTK